MLSIYKRKRDVLDCGSHSGVKLIDRVMIKKCTLE